MSGSTAPARPRLRVVKVGGSLFDWPQMAQALKRWLDHEPPAVNVLIAGGGAFANTVRQADHALGLGEEQSHWLCVDLLGVTARMLALVLGEGTRTICQLAEIPLDKNTATPACLVFDVREFLRVHEPCLPGCRLPRTWSVTSDSIAARVAQVIEADELVLLKSAEPPAGKSIAEWACAGYVDSSYPTIAAQWQGRIRLVNLRGQSAVMGGQDAAVVH